MDTNRGVSPWLPMWAWPEGRQGMQETSCGCVGQHSCWSRDSGDQTEPHIGYRMHSVWNAEGDGPTGWFSNIEGSNLSLHPPPPPPHTHTQHTCTTHTLTRQVVQKAESEYSPLSQSSTNSCTGRGILNRKLTNDYTVLTTNSCTGGEYWTGSWLMTIQYWLQTAAWGGEYWTGSWLMTIQYWDSLCGPPVCWCCVGWDQGHF